RAARLAPDEDRRGRLLFAAADVAWLAGSGDRAIGLLAEARALAPGSERLVRIEHLEGLIAARQGPVMDGYAILVAAAERAAERAAESEPELAVTMLPEAVDA